MRYALGFIPVLVVALLMACGAPDAKADTIHDVLAIQAVPELGHQNVTLETSGYFNRVDESEVFTAGLGFGVFGTSIGASVVYDTGPMDNVRTFAVAATVPLGQYTGLRVGVAPDFDADGFDKFGTFGATLRFGF